MIGRFPVPSGLFKRGTWSSLTCDGQAPFLSHAFNNTAVDSVISDEAFPYDLGCNASVAVAVCSLKASRVLAMSSPVRGAICPDLSRRHGPATLLAHFHVTSQSQTCSSTIAMGDPLALFMKDCLGGEGHYFSDSV